MGNSSGQKQIIIGIDGSAGARAAVEWALAEARLRGAGLRIIYAFPALVSIFGTTAHEHYPEAQAEAEQQFEEMLATVPPMDDLEVQRTLIAGNPAEVLVEASREASLLVVGSRGVGGFRGLMVGSVSMQCISHAHCPVVVVR